MGVIAVTSDRHQRTEAAPDPAALITGGYAPSVWLTGQRPARTVRVGRYVAESKAHPGKMLPAIATHAIAAYTRPGDLVLDPMAGIGTTLVEAVHLGRHSIGVEYEPRWARLAAANLRHATGRGATGTGAVFTGDARHLTDLLPARLRGQVTLVVTSPPYGSATHGHARAPGPHGKVRKVNNRYGADPSNLAYTTHEQLAAGFTAILTGCAAMLRPGGHVVITARPYRADGELVDIPGMAAAAGQHAGLVLLDECIALLAGIRHGRLMPHASFFQVTNARNTTGHQQWITQHEEVLVLENALPRQKDTGQHRSARSQSDPAAEGGGLDHSGPPYVDPRRQHLANPTTTRPGGTTTDARPDRGQHPEGTTDPCPSSPVPASPTGPSTTTGQR
jgi:hypothetical protein